MINANRMISEDKLEELYAFLHRTKDLKLVIWGAGSSGEKVLKYINMFGYENMVKCFIDSDPSKEKTTFLGIPVISPKMLQQDRQYAVIVASVYHREIIPKLIEYSITDYYDSVSLLYPGTKSFKKFYKEREYMNYFCPIPFERLFIYSNSASICCPQYISDIPVGNPKCDTIGELWNSPMAKEIRSSVLNGTFCFCDMDICPYAKDGTMTKRENVTDSFYKEIIENEITTIERGPKILNIAFDDSCNLSCKMCRSTKIDCYNDDDIIKIGGGYFATQVGKR